MKRRYLVLIVAAAAVLLAYLYWRPLPPVQASPLIPTVPKTQSNDITWPTANQAALGAVGYGVVAEHNDTTPVPIASIAKLITALAVLRQKPLAAGTQGPIVTLDDTDVNYFDYYFLNDGSVAQVKSGEKISEYQLLEAMLMPSANNIADTLARWAFGSIGDYVTYANQMVSQMGLTHTSVGSTNGFADKTTSTAGDLVKLGLAAMQNPVIVQIVGQSTASIPVEGTINNVNYLLGSDGVVGIKTGNTDKAGGCYLFASKQTVLDKPMVIIGAILDAKNLVTAIQEAPSLIAVAAGNFQQVKVINSGDSVGGYKAPWGPSAQLKTTEDLSLLIWKGQAVKIKGNFAPANAPLPAGSQIGTVTVQSGYQMATAPLVLSGSLPAPSWHWKILRR